MNTGSVEKRNIVISVKVTEAESKEIKQNAINCGMNVSSFCRARMLGYKPQQRLTEEELLRLGNLQACRVDMVNYANALSGLTREERSMLFHNHKQMYKWYCVVVPVTNAVIEYLQYLQQANIFRPRSINQ